MMLYRIIFDEDGEYADADGRRCTLQIVRGCNHPELFTPFPSLDECLAAWHLQLR